MIKAPFGRFLHSSKCRRLVGLLLHVDRVSGLMIMDLEDEKVVDRSKRLGVVSGYSQLRAVLGISCCGKGLRVIG